MTTDRPSNDLPTILVSVAAELVAERGPTGFSLREVARRAGVSHAAPAHHFGDSKGLLTSVAVEGFEALARSFDEAIVGVEDPTEQLCRLGKAYVETALRLPGHFGIMCNDELVNRQDPALAVASIGAYERLLIAIGDIRDALNPELDVEAAATLAWSMVHGLAVLAPAIGAVADKTGTSPKSVDIIVEQFNSMLVNGLAAR